MKAIGYQAAAVAIAFVAASGFALAEAPTVVKTNAALKALSSPAATTVLRCGIAADGDAPCLTFKKFNDTCDSAGLTDDVGYCVNSDIAGHWVAQPGDGRMHWSQFGPLAKVEQASASVAFGGGATAGDVVMLTFGALATSVAYTVRAGDTLASIADALVLAVYDSVPLRREGIRAAKSGNTVILTEWGRGSATVEIGFSLSRGATETVAISQMTGGGGSLSSAASNTAAIQHAIDDAYQNGFDTLDDVAGPGCVPITTLNFYGNPDGYTPRAGFMGYFGVKGSCMLRTVSGGPGMRSVTSLGGTQVTQQVNAVLMQGLTIHGQGLAGTDLLLEGVSNSDFRDLVLDDSSNDATWSFTQYGGVTSNLPTANLTQLTVPNVSQSANNHFSNVYLSMPYTDSTTLHGIAVLMTAPDGYTLPLVNYNHFDEVLGFFAKTGVDLRSGNDNTFTHTDFGIDTTSYRICTSNEGHFCAHNKLDRPYLDNGCCGQTATWVSIGSDARQTIVSHPTSGTLPGNPPGSNGSVLLDPASPATQTVWYADGVYEQRADLDITQFYPQNTTNYPQYAIASGAARTAHPYGPGSGYTVTFAGSNAATMAIVQPGWLLGDLTDPRALSNNTVVSQVSCVPNCATATSVTLTATKSLAAIAQADLIQAANAANAKQLIGNDYNQTGYYQTSFAAKGVFDCIRYDGMHRGVAGVKSAEPLCSFGALGYNGTALGSEPRIEATATEDWSPSATGTAWTLYGIDTGTNSVNTALTLRDGALVLRAVKAAQLTDNLGCGAATNGYVVLVTDLARPPTYRAAITIASGGGSYQNLAVCDHNAGSWVAQ